MFEFKNEYLFGAMMFFNEKKIFFSNLFLVRAKKAHHQNIIR